MSGIATDVWLVVEDNDDDYLLFVRACRRALNRGADIHREKDGVAAAEFLKSCQSKPQLIISDLKMPRMSGLEFLEWVRQRETLKRVPFVMLSSSNLERDVEAARRLGADAYKVKPSDYSALVSLVTELDSMPIGPSSNRAPRRPGRESSGDLKAA
jgi:two-component system response regulator